MVSSGLRAGRTLTITIERRPRAAKHAWNGPADSAYENLAAEGNDAIVGLLTACMESGRQL
jgi:hypothetical protein